MTIVYISGPMTGLPNFNIQAFKDAEEQLQAAGFEIISPLTVQQRWGFGHPWRWYMREALKQLAEADTLAMLPGWSGSRGAVLERKIAEGLGLPVLALSDLLDTGAPLAAPCYRSELRDARALLCGQR